MRDLNKKYRYELENITDIDGITENIKWTSELHIKTLEELESSNPYQKGKFYLLGIKEKKLQFENETNNSYLSELEEIFSCLFIIVNEKMEIQDVPNYDMLIEKFLITMEYVDEMNLKAGSIVLLSEILAEKDRLIYFLSSNRIFRHLFFPLYRFDEINFYGRLPETIEYEFFDLIPGIMIPMRLKKIMNNGKIIISGEKDDLLLSDYSLERIIREKYNHNMRRYNLDYKAAIASDKENGFIKDYVFYSQLEIDYDINIFQKVKIIEI